MSVNSDNNDFSFKKTERLHHRNDIKELFEKGSSFYLYPFKVLYLAKPLNSTIEPHQILLSVPKRKFKKAPDRNFIKRQLREAYRHNKQLIDPKILNKKLRIAYIYTSDKKMPSSSLEKKLKKTLERLIQEFSKG